MDIYKRLELLGIQLVETPVPAGIYYQVKEFGESLCYISGSGPNIVNGRQFYGKIGKDYTLEEGREAARCATLNMLSILHTRIGDLNSIKRFVKLLCFVACENDFYQQPEVANGASELLIEIFGEEVGRSARSAIGVNVLPQNIPFEIEALIELK